MRRRTCHLRLRRTRAAGSARTRVRSPDDDRERSHRDRAHGVARQHDPPPVEAVGQDAGGQREERRGEEARERDEPCLRRRVCQREDEQWVGDRRQRAAGGRQQLPGLEEHEVAVAREPHDRDSYQVRLRRGGQRQPETRAERARLRGCLAAVRLGRLADDREAEAGARLRACGRRAVEAVEDARQILFGDPRPAVRNDDLALAAPSLRSERPAGCT